MSDDAQAIESTIREDLQRLSDLLESIRRGLLELHDKIAAAPEEESRQDLDEAAELSTRLRADLRCLLTDAIEPALRKLHDLTSFAPPTA